MIDIKSLIERNRGGEKTGLPCFCTANEYVLRSVFEYAALHQLPAVVEATCNQVNQDGGYTGMKAADFSNWIELLAKEYGVNKDQVILGGDHLGPNPWKHLPASQAMEKAETLVKDYATAGFRKIHLDASMACADEPTPSFETVAERAARLCQVAEDHSPHKDELIYIIGTEVPTPGGETDDMSELSVTSIERLNDTINTHKEAFEQKGLLQAWPKVVSVVTQPGVDFSHTAVHPFEPEAAQELAGAILNTKGFSYEAHSTDYQTDEGLSALVDMHFFFLKVGPELTFRMREAAFALSYIEETLDGGNKSDLIKVIDAAMDENRSDWQPYYQGDAETVSQLRHYSYSDRIRYYWNVPAVKNALNTLLGTLEQRNLPETIVSQYFPAREFGTLNVSANKLLTDHVRLCIERYYRACAYS